MSFRLLLVAAVILLAACSGSAEPTAAPELPIAESDAPTTTTTIAEPASTTTTAAPSSPSDEPPTPGDAALLEDLPGRLAVVRDDGTLVLVDPTGEQEEGIDSTEGRRAAQPAWSPDAERLSWSSTGRNETSVRIAVLTGGNGVEIAMTSPVFYHAWDSTGTQLATLRSAGNGIQFEVHDAIEGTTLPIAIGQPFYFDWTGDGNSLIAAVNGRTVARVELDQRAGTDLALSSGLGFFQSPSVLGDGSFVVALGNAGGSARLVRVDATGEETALAGFDGAVAMATSPAGDRLAVLVSADPNEPQLERASFQLLPELPSGQVSVIDLTDGTVTTLPHRDIAAVNWSPDGRWLAGLQIRDGAAQWVLDDGTDVVTGPAFVPSQAFATEYLPFADQYNQSHRWWSPDGSAMVLNGTIAGESGVWIDVIDDPGGAIRISDGSIAVWSPQ